MGYGPMAYFVFGNSGINWQSHRPDWTPHAPILALTLRNQHAGGDLLGVETLAVPTYDVPGAAVASGGHGAGSNRRGAAIEPKHDVPTILCYPFRSGTDLSVILISREPREKRTVKVDLPFTPKPDYTEVRLQHPDPWANNRDEVMLKEQVVPKRGSGRTLTVDLEPHSMVVVKLSAN